MAVVINGSGLFQQDTAPCHIAYIGSHLSSWIMQGLCIICLCEHLHKRFGIQENLVNSENKNLFSIPAHKCV